MKIAVIKPLYKNEDITSMTNYMSDLWLFFCRYLRKLCTVN